LIEARPQHRVPRLWQMVRGLPNLITLLRLLLAPAMVMIAYTHGDALLVLGLMAFCFCTDLIDGALARWLRSASPSSARLDSIADFTFYLCIPLAGWLVWPSIVAEQGPWFVVGVTSVVLPAGVALAKFRQASSYHVWLAKLAAGGMAVGVLLLFGCQIVLPFHAAVVIATLAAVEEIAITLVLDRPRADVRGLWQVLAERRARARSADRQAPSDPAR
jgi:phosphatidylglycerophosphate synthase